jgi:prefoldin subunit 5
MATIVSTTALTALEAKLLDDSPAHASCRNIAAQIEQMQEHLSRLQGLKTTVDAALAKSYADFLKGRSPVVPVPDGAKVTRKKVNNVDSLIVSTGS